MDPKANFDALEIATIEEWIATQRQEDLHLEFKLLEAAPDFTKDDRKNLAKAISGFANSDGGLIVWGVNCRKNSAGVDCATEIAPVKNAASALSKLQSLTGEASVPIADGISHRLLPASGDGGILVSYVPRSDCGPHMAKLGENRYYKRSGDSFYQMEHFDLADMFGRRPPAVLRVNLALTTGAVSSGFERSTDVQAIVGIENSGRAVARFPFLRVRAISPYKLSGYELDGNGRPGLRALIRSARHPDWRSYTGGVDDVVHPGTTFDVTLVTLAVGDSTTSVPDLVVKYQLAADGFPLSDGMETILGDRVLDAARQAMDRAFPRK
jgi:Putative DNA-binding domain